jgi:hypothetical protein
MLHGLCPAYANTQNETARQWSGSQIDRQIVPENSAIWNSVVSLTSRWVREWIDTRAAANNRRVSQALSSQEFFHRWVGALVFQHEEAATLKDSQGGAGNTVCQ